MLRRFSTTLLVLCLLSASLTAGGCHSAQSDPSSKETDSPSTVTEELSETTETDKPEKENKGMKYFTLSFDDGITQDLRLIELLNKYNMKCCSFNLNTGLYGASWEWVGVSQNRPDVTHIRFTEEEIRTGIYDGFDVQVHTMTHPSLIDFDNDVEGLKYQINQDADNIEALFGIRPVGMAWPGGDGCYSDRTIELVLEHTDIRFARGTTATNTYELPERFMKWMPTCAIFDPMVLLRAGAFIKAEAEEDMLFYVWGHSYDLDIHNDWDTLEKLLQMMSEADDVCFITTTEFYHLYKDRIPS
ncbi:MAG: polysaccharide deacetylase family protein [Clostridia bacterium]|nr:polysaccharide deacetylase family protein [Clostridia bacterium]